jgi:hypothetical protein
MNFFSDYRPKFSTFLVAFYRRAEVTWLEIKLSRELLFMEKKKKNNLFFGCSRIAGKCSYPGAGPGRVWPELEGLEAETKEGNNDGSIWRLTTGQGNDFVGGKK